MVRPWTELSDYIALRRVGGLRLAPDGSRLVAPVSELKPDRKGFTSALWEIDPEGRAEARRLTRSVEGESAPAFLPDGSLLFTSKRPDAESETQVEAPALWLLPADGGEARRVAARPGGISGVTVAADAGTIAFTSEVFPGAADTEADEKARKARKDAGVSAILHESQPVRSWDHDIGPALPRLFVADPPADGAATLPEPRDLTPEAGKTLLGADTRLSPDGGTLLVTFVEQAGKGALAVELVSVDTATGERRVLDAPGVAHGYSGGRFSPDGGLIAIERSFEGDYDGEPRDSRLWLIDHATGEGRDLLPGKELWPREITWSADGTAVLFIADENGRRPVFRVTVADGELTRLTGDHGAYSELNPARDGSALYTLRDAFDAPPAPVRLDPVAADQQPTALKSPMAPVDLPGTLAEVETTADDGTRVRSWLVLPADATADSPAPLVLWVHGGPYMSFNGWSWRWNPWLLAERGYAVLLPDPALSTGYGQDMLRRAWGNWGPRTFADVMSITDAAVARDDIDGERTAMMGGSFGGYMANWIAGHTKRFKAIVSHASLWALDSFGAVTDHPPVWAREFGEPRTRPERFLRNSPHLHSAQIRTPMLVIHGDRDYRVPIGEGLRLWWDLVENEVDAKFLYFPDENHWILTPGNIAVWYETVYAFLDHHVLGKDWRRPDLL